MPCVQTKIERNQALLRVLILPTNSWAENLKKEKRMPLDVGGKYCHALIDTGATQSCKSNHTADDLRIRPTGSKQMQGAHGSKLANLYVADFVLIDVRWAIEGMSLAEVNFPKECPYQAIIGMDLISRGTLHFNYRSSLSPEGVCTFCI